MPTKTKKPGKARAKKLPRGLEDGELVFATSTQVELLKEIDKLFSGPDAPAARAFLRRLVYSFSETSFRDLKTIKADEDARELVCRKLEEHTGMSWDPEVIEAERRERAKVVAGDTTLKISPPVQLTEGAEGRVVPFAEVSEAISIVGLLIDSYSGDVTGPGPSDLGTFIHNNGNEEECCEALLALAPIARRVYERKTNES